jgi:transcriptional regulator with AAA-type ATPase domain
MMADVDGTGEQTALDALLAAGPTRTEEFRELFRLCVELYSASSVRTEECLRGILAAAQRAGHLQAVCLAHQRLAEALLARGDHAGSLVQADHVLTSARACGEARYEASYHFLAGRVHEAAGQYADARSSYQQAFAIYVRTNHHEGQRAALNQLANVAWCLGSPEEALEQYQRAMELSGEAVTDEERVTYQHNVGLALAALGRWEDAAEAYHRALALSEQSSAEIARVASRCRVLCSLGELLLLRDSVDQAIDVFKEVIRCAERSDAVRTGVLTETYAHLGHAYYLRGEWANAEQAYRSGLAAAAQRNDRVSRVGVLWRAAELALAKGELSVCHTYVSEAVGLAQEMGLVLDVADSWRVQALLHAARSEPQSARDCFERALGVLKDLDEGYELARVRYHYGRFLLAVGDRRAGESELRAAARVFRGLAVVREAEDINRLLFAEEQSEDRDMALLQAVTRLATFGLEPRRYLEQVLKMVCEGAKCNAGAIVLDGRPEIVYGRSTAGAIERLAGSGDTVITPGEIGLTVWKGASTARLCLLRSETSAAAHSRFVFEAISSLLAPALERLAAMAKQEPGMAGEPLLPRVLGRSPAMVEAAVKARRAADTGVPVLIRGESGTGKKLFARALHEVGETAQGPFVVLSCAALLGSVFESELLGVERAAGVPARPGKLEQARGGSLLLDGVAELPLATQSLLLRILQERSEVRAGGRLPAIPDVRVVATTSRDLENMAARGEFLAGLCRQLSGEVVAVPPLRERLEDIPELVGHFTAACSQQYGRHVRGATPEALALLAGYSWPGNVRELKYAVEHGVLIAKGDMIGIQDLPASMQPGPYSR